jgi:hypothetical protein
MSCHPACGQIDVLGSDTNAFRAHVGTDVHSTVVFITEGMSANLLRETAR